MKGMILAAGLGTRLRPLTSRHSKPLVPVVNRPLISYPLSALVDAGVDDIIIVAGKNEAELRAALPAITTANLTFVNQPEPLGLAHAVNYGRTAVGNEDCILLFCDNIFSEPLSGSLAEWNRLRNDHADLGAMIHVVEVDDPRAFGVAVVRDGWVIDMEEKPAKPRSNLAIVGIDFMRPAIFEAIPRIKPSARGELEITDALFELTRMGMRVYARRLPGFWFDTGTFADLIDVTRPLLDSIQPQTSYGSLVNCRVSGLMNTATSAVFEDCEIIGPVICGSGARIKNCQLGPYVAIGAGARIQDSRLSFAQVYPDTKLTGKSIQKAIVCPEGIIFRNTPPAE